MSVYNRYAGTIFPSHSPSCPIGFLVLVFFFFFFVRIPPSMMAPQAGVAVYKTRMTFKHPNRYQLFTVDVFRD
jgi:hypothetical protein